MLLWRLKWPFKCDGYFLRFPQGSEIAPHIDRVTTGKHFRLNIVLQRAQLGGEFICDKPMINTTRFKLFRPDVSLHQVTKIRQGNRLVLSVGWLRNN